MDPVTISVIFHILTKITLILILIFLLVDSGRRIKLWIIERFENKDSAAKMPKLIPLITLACIIIVAVYFSFEPSNRSINSIDSSLHKRRMEQARTEEIAPEIVADDDLSIEEKTKLMEEQNDQENKEAKERFKKLGSS